MEVFSQILFAFCLLLLRFQSCPLHLIPSGIAPAQPLVADKPIEILLAGPSVAMEQNTVGLQQPAIAPAPKCAHTNVKQTVTSLTLSC